MKERILALFKTKFHGVDETILSRIAEKKVNGMTDESQVQTIVDGVSFQDVLNSYGDFRAHRAVVSAVANYEKRHNLKNGKPVETISISTQPLKVQPEMVKMITDVVNAAVKPLSDKLADYYEKEAQIKRRADILMKAKEYGIPDPLVPMLKITEDTDLDTFIKDVQQVLVNTDACGNLKS